MRIPIIRGVIDRRILANYRVDPQVLRRVVPAPFRPKLAHGHGIAGICLIRLRNVRPRWWPLPLGIGSENAAHRIAVEWDENGQTKEGVFIPRRDSNSRFNALVGGRLFAGVQHHAKFDVRETGGHYHIALRSDDGHVRVCVEGSETDALPADSIFASLPEVSAFFERGSLGYSVTRTPGTFDGMRLHSFTWALTPLKIERIESSYFDDAATFPPGSVTFDNALLMRQVEHEWHGQATLCAACACIAGDGRHRHSASSNRTTFDTAGTGFFRQLSPGGGAVKSRRRIVTPTGLRPSPGFISRQRSTKVCAYRRCIGSWYVPVRSCVTR
jgi:hypothetical protein